MLYSCSLSPTSRLFVRFDVMHFVPHLWPGLFSLSQSPAVFSTSNLCILSRIIFSSPTFLGSSELVFSWSLFLLFLCSYLFFHRLLLVSLEFYSIESLLSGLRILWPSNLLVAFFFSPSLHFLPGTFLLSSLLIHLQLSCPIRLIHSPLAGFLSLAVRSSSFPTPSGWLLSHLAFFPLWLSPLGSPSCDAYPSGCPSFPTSVIFWVFSRSRFTRSHFCVLSCLLGVILALV